MFFYVVLALIVITATAYLGHQAWDWIVVSPTSDREEA